MKHKLIVFDMDGVIFRAHNFWMEVHKVFGTFEEGRALTDKYLLTDYERLVKEVVERLWKGRDAEKYLELIDSVEYYEGVKETFDSLKQRGLKIAIITCGPSHLVDRLKKDGIHLDYDYSNHLSIENGKIAGEFDWPVAEGRNKKVYLLEKICKKENIPLTEVIGVADGKSDLEMMQACGFSIAFCPTSDEIAKLGDVVINKPDLRLVLPYIR